jgi:MFS transporter, PAT family, beta-lactamase induction signal transducer AmpG
VTLATCDARAQRPPAAFTYPLLILPYGIQNGFIRISLTFIATQHGLNITDGALLVGAQFATQWMKWLWAPLVDLTLTYKHWYRLATITSAASLVTACAVPLNQTTLPIVLTIVAIGGLANSVVGMSVEAMMAAATPRNDIGKASGWFQAGSLGGTGIGGGLGLLLLKALPSPWMAGAILGALVVSPCLALKTLGERQRAVHGSSPADALRALLREVRTFLHAPRGRFVLILCMLPIGLGAAFSVLAQAAVAIHWGVGASDVALLQGALAGVSAIGGALAGGRLCSTWLPHRVYAGAGAMLAAVAIAMSFIPPTVTSYAACTLSYAFVAGIAYAAFTAVVLGSIGTSAAATKYNIFASLANFPLWWLGLVLGWVAQHHGAITMLQVEAAFGLLGVVALLLLAARGTPPHIEKIVTR